MYKQIITAKVKDAFGRSRINGSKVEDQTFVVDGSDVYIWDDISETYTTCHSLSERVLTRIRRLAD